MPIEPLEPEDWSQKKGARAAQSRGDLVSTALSHKRWGSQVCVSVVRSCRRTNTGRQYDASGGRFLVKAHGGMYRRRWRLPCGNHCHHDATMTQLVITGYTLVGMTDDSLDECKLELTVDTAISLGRVRQRWMSEYCGGGHRLR